MSILNFDEKKFFEMLAKDGVETVEMKLAKGHYGHEKDVLAKLWLQKQREKEKEGREKKRDSWLKSQTKALWVIVVLTVISIGITFAIALFTVFRD